MAGPFVQKNLKVILGAVLLLMILTIPLNCLIGGKLRTQEKAVPVKMTDDFGEDVAASHETLNSDDPQQYGIIVQSQAELPRGQMEWEMFMKKVLSPSEKDNDSASEKDFKNKMRDLSSRIKYYESLRNKRPGDREIEEKLSRLYQLKATLGAIKQ